MKMPSSWGAGRRVLMWKAARLAHRIDSLEALPGRSNCLIVSVDDPLPQTQVWPYYHYADALRRAYGLRFSEIDATRVDEAAPPRPRSHVRWVLFQNWFDVEPEAVRRRAEFLQAAYPNAALVYLDWFAPVHLRYAEVLDPLVRWYVKKQAFRDFARYDESVRGDTNLTDYFSRRYGIELPEYRDTVPPGFERKLVLGSNFGLSPQMIDGFLQRQWPESRPIDVHARIATKGVHWYQRMREEAAAAVRGLPDLRVASQGRVSLARFFEELRQSKVCFSPIGYGEVCWRDFEAVMCGALLIKPDVGHLRITPDIFRAGETYASVRWDLADFDEVVRGQLADVRGRERIAQQAFDVVSSYIRAGAFVTELAPVFS